MNKLFCIGIALVALIGCSPAQDDEAKIFTLTVVHLIPGGPDQVVVSQISRADQLRHMAARERVVRDGIGQAQQAIGQDTGCDFADMEMWDQTGEWGNTICFDGTGTATLSNYARGTGNWQSATQSFMAGISAGDFDHSYPSSCTTPFAAYAVVSPADHCTAQSTHLTLN